MDARPRATRKVELAGAQKTLLIPLYAKALDSRSKNSILKDRKADEIVRSLDYDFANLEGLGVNNLLVVRAKQFDDWVKEFLRSNPKAVVLNLGCGLDSRVARIGPPPGVDWFDVDFPAVIKERRRFFSDGEGYTMVGSSITQQGWLETIPRDRPVMAVADGVLEYVTEDDARTLFNRLTSCFPSGQIAFDVMSSGAVERGRSRLKDLTGAEHKWAVDDLRKVDRLDPKLRRVDSLSIFNSELLSGLPLRHRLTYKFANLSSGARDMIRLLRYEF